MIPGLLALELEPSIDVRGSFTRYYDAEVLAGAGQDAPVTASAISVNTAERTLRGLHYQAEPHSGPKVVACLRGRIFDVTADLRPESPTYGRWEAFVLDARTAEAAVLIPRGCAHGFMTLEPNSEVIYHLSETHEPAAERGIRWDDPGLGVRWPDEPRVMSDRDAAFPDFPW